MQTHAPDAGPARPNASPGGFPAATSALPSPGITPPHTPGRTRRDNTAARPGPPAAVRLAPSPQQTPAP
jgi:hypothetical protein